MKGFCILHVYKAWSFYLRVAPESYMYVLDALGHMLLRLEREDEANFISIKSRIYTICKVEEWDIKNLQCWS